MKTGDWVKVESPTVPLNVRAHQHRDDPHPVRLRNVYSVANRHIGLALDHGETTAVDLTITIHAGQLTLKPLDPPPHAPDFSHYAHVAQRRVDLTPYLRHMMALLITEAGGTRVLASAAHAWETHLRHVRQGHIPTSCRRGLALLAAVDAGLNPVLLPPLSDAAAAWTGTTADLLRGYQAASTND